MVIYTKQNLNTLEPQIIKKLSKNDDELKKTVAYKKACICI